MNTLKMRMKNPDSHKFTKGTFAELLKNSMNGSVVEIGTISGLIKKTFCKNLVDVLVMIIYDLHPRYIYRDHEDCFYYQDEKEKVFTLGCHPCDQFIGRNIDSPRLFIRRGDEFFLVEENGREVTFGVHQDIGWWGVGSTGPLIGRGQNLFHVMTDGSERSLGKHAMGGSGFQAGAFGPIFARSGKFFRVNFHGQEIPLSGKYPKFNTWNIADHGLILFDEPGDKVYYYIIK